MVKVRTVNGKNIYTIDVSNLPAEKAVEYVKQILEKHKCHSTNS